MCALFVKTVEKRIFKKSGYIYIYILTPRGKSHRRPDHKERPLGRELPDPGPRVGLKTVMGSEQDGQGLLALRPPPEGRSAAGGGYSRASKTRNRGGALRPHLSRVMSLL